MLAPTLVVADDTICQTKVNQFKITGHSANVPQSFLTIRGTIFGEGEFALCDLQTPVDTGRTAGTPNTVAGEFRIFPQECARWLTAIELAMALEMEVNLIYEASIQPDCSNLLADSYPLALEVLKNAAEN